MSETQVRDAEEIQVRESRTNIGVLAPQSKAHVSPVSFMLRMLRVFAGLSAVAAAGYFLWANLAQVHSRQAFINGMLIQVRSPIEGIVHLDRVTPGTEVEGAKPLGVIKNRNSRDLETSCDQYTSRIVEDKHELDNLTGAMQQCEGKLSKYKDLMVVQNKLDIQYAQNQYVRYQNEWRDATEASNFGKQESELERKLSNIGALPTRVACKAESDYLRSDQLRQAKWGELQAAEAQLQAAQAGLSVGTNRELSTPANRIEELERELIQLKLKEIDLHMQLSQDEFSLNKAKSMVHLDSSVPMKSPEKGVVWSVLARTGELVTPGATIANILTPDRRWVEAFVSEKDVHRLHIGGKAVVKLVGSNQKFKATIESIRAGVGRISAGQPVAVPPPERERKETELRLTVDWPNVVSSTDFGANQFYGVGRSVEVDFD